MANWPIRRKLLVLPIVAVTAALSITSFVKDRGTLALCSGVGSVALLAAWLVASRLSRRINTLRDSLSRLLDRGGAPPAEAAQSRDEIQALSERMHQAIFRGRERETQARRSSEFLEFAQAAGGFGIFDLDLVTGQVTGTTLFFDLLGLKNPRALFTRDAWLATIHPEDYEHVVQQLNVAIRTAGSFQADYRSLRQDGAICWLAGRGQVLLDAEDLPARAIGTITDITERKQLEDTRRRALESLNQAQAVAGIATVDLDFRHGRWTASDNFHELLGISATTPLDDLDGHLAAVHADDVERVRRAPFGTTPNNPTYRCDYRVTLSDGSLRAIAATATVVRDANGALARITGAFVDVTRVKHATAVKDGAERRFAVKARSSQSS